MFGGGENHYTPQNHYLKNVDVYNYLGGAKFLHIVRLDQGGSVCNSLELRSRLLHNFSDKNPVILMKGFFNADFGFEIN